MQMVVAIKKILYAADAKELALADAQDCLAEDFDGGEAVEGN